jgi:hypothetical protein
MRKNSCPLRSWLRHVALAALFSLVCAPTAVAQTDFFAGPPAIDVLGAHANAGRGCASCHVPHNNELSGNPAATPSAILWGTAEPDYGEQLALSDSGHRVDILPAAFSSASSEVNGVLICISCHDGNITPQNMLAGQSYEQRIGMLPWVRRSAVPTFLGDTLASRYAVDHPLGVQARIETGDGLEFSDGKFSVQRDSPYARFVADYGWPTLAPRGRSNPYGIDPDGQPYLLCTTCHNQHAMSAFVSRPDDAIAGDGGGRIYATYFFVNGPYNSNLELNSNQMSGSNAQFCRQCHFRLSNEGNGQFGIPTAFAQ